MKVYSRIITVRVLSAKQDRKILISEDGFLSRSLASFQALDHLAQWHDRRDLQLREVSEITIEEYTPSEPVGV